MISYNIEDIFLSIFFHRICLLFLIQFSIWFMSLKLISNAIAKSSDIMVEFWYSISSSSNIDIPSPPSRGAKDNSFLSCSVIVIPTVIAGINSVKFMLITNYEASVSSLWFYFCDFAIWSSSTHSFIFPMIHSSLYWLVPWAAPRFLLPCVAIWMLVSFTAWKVSK